MRVLVTGGAGYIGSHTAKALAAAGFAPVVFDNLSMGHRWTVRWGPLVEGDVADTDLVRDTLRRYRIEAVLHFAASASVAESMRHPRRYFRNNVMTTLSLVDAMLDEGVKRVVFSSSCATYGLPERLPIAEDHPQRPINPYGETKAIGERILHWYGQSYGLRSVVLRYFNAAGADPDGELGEAHDPETHLIPLAIAAALGHHAHLAVYGTDYPTPDGTAVRDYVHVTDLADAHVRALGYLVANGDNLTLNLGTGTGYSVAEIIAAVEAATGRPMPHHVAPPRRGDPPMLVADATRAAEILGWRPYRSALDAMVGSAWHWHHAAGAPAATGGGAA